MPRINVKQPSSEVRRAHPREYALLHQLGALDQEALKTAAVKYGDAAKAEKLLESTSSGDVAFEDFAKAFSKPSPEVDGEGNTLGWAARDKSAQLSAYKFNRRDLKPDDIFIKITHAGMCHSDLHTINGDWGEVKYPVVPGHEIVGIVVEVGEQVSKFKVGDRAGVGVLVGCCKSCSYCKEGEEMYCPKIVFTYNSKHPSGEMAQGGYSTHLIVEQSFAHTIPSNLPLEGVAPLLCAGITTWTPYKEHQLDKPGYRIGVVGLGGLGHMAVKWGAAFGCEVVVISRSKAKEAEALKLGASSVLVSTDEEAMKAAAGTFAGIIDTVSAKHDINALLGLLDTKGKLVLVGLPPAGLEINHFLLVMKNLTLAGSVVGQLEDTQKMLDFCGEKGITADVEVVDAEYANDAIERMIKGDVKFRFVIDVQKSIVA